MNCPGSVALIGDESSTAGIEAMRGTAAHKFIEHMLQNDEHDASIYLHFYARVHIDSKEETQLVDAEPKPIEGWMDFECDETMVNGVQMMIDEHDRIVETCFDPIVYTERFLDMSWLDPRLGGTADDTIVDPGWINLLDYKNGRIVVEVTGNEQMKNYAVGLLHEHPEAQGVTVTLVQPNAIHEEGCIRTESYSADELKLFEIQMKQAADATSRPNAPRRTGDWCIYCPAKIRCPEFDEMALEEAAMDFREDAPDTPPDDGVKIEDIFNDDDGGESYRAMLARKRKWIKVLDAWARSLNQAIYNEMMNGRVVPGVKLVAGKSNRKYVSDEQTTANALVEAGIPNESIWTEPELKSPAQIEKIRPPGMKAAMVKKIVEPLTHKPPGRITIADEDDARPAVDPGAAAITDFADDPADDDFA